MASVYIHECTLNVCTCILVVSLAFTWNLCTCISLPHTLNVCTCIFVVHVHWMFIHVYLLYTYTTSKSCIHTESLYMYVSSTHIECLNMMEETFLVRVHISMCVHLCSVYSSIMSTGPIHNFPRTCTHLCLRHVPIPYAPYSIHRRGGGLGSRPIFKKFNEPYAPS